MPVRQPVRPALTGDVRPVADVVAVPREQCSAIECHPHVIPNVTAGRQASERRVLWCGSGRGMSRCTRLCRRAARSGASGSRALSGSRRQRLRVTTGSFGGHARDDCRDYEHRSDATEQGRHAEVSEQPAGDAGAIRLSSNSVR